MRNGLDFFILSTVGKISKFLMYISKNYYISDKFFKK